MKGYNVLYICDYAAQYSGNFIPCMAALAEAASKQNQVFFLFPCEAKGKDWLNNLRINPQNIFFCDFAPKNLFLYCRKLAAELGNAPILTHTHFVDGWCLMAVRLVFSNHVFHYHMSVPEEKKLDKKIKKVVKNLIAHNSVIIGVSKTVSQNLKRYYKNNPVICVSNAVDFDRLEAISAAYPMPQCIDKETFSILIHGTNFWVKGTDIAVRAVEALNREGLCSCKLYTTSNDIPNTAKMISDISTDNEHMCIIPVREDVINLYNSVDLFISPSRQEAFSYSIVEACHSNCQVVSSDIPGPDSLKDIPCVQWIEPDNVDSLKKSILTAISNKASGVDKDMKRTQKQYVVNKYNVAPWVQSVLDVYDTYFHET